MPDTKPGPIVVIGSGEMADAMAETHRALFARLGEAPRPVFLDTPAGFELNVDQIDQKAVSYFSRNFGLDLALARYRNAEVDPAQIGAALTAIQRANYLFAGPGSPSYGIRIWRNSPVWQSLCDRWREGAMIAFSSAAATTLGALSIPVYEIYKVGEPVHWIEGLDLLGVIGIRAAVVPHWNNGSGDQHDTRFCFMGAPRLEQLERQLPEGVAIIGVDEYTALFINSETCRAEVLGLGEVTIRLNGRQTVYRHGATFIWNEIQQSPMGLSEASLTAKDTDNINTSAPILNEKADSDIAQLRDSVQGAFARNDYQAAVNGLVALGLTAGVGLEQGLPGRAEASVQALQATLPLLANAAPDSDGEHTSDTEFGTLIDLLVELRTELRQAKQWAFADRIRDKLTALDIAIADTPDGTSWQRL